MAHFFMFLLGLLFLAGAIFLVLWVKRREFYRRNEAGVEEFGDFKQMASARTLEFLAYWVASILAVMGIASIGMVLADIF
ncbi:hypothetical protein [Suttonella ornithocola]|uniref:Uncharacterized protein n=1 Tax=Suttonella ornithocola TaxID=279832 RepID=A0A380N243_9GAMM|nr:hypothetical protein [Suttonella ornithocola]SUO97837.1 Uncharacterised protein [Suttonella ornithocola]